MEVIDFISLLDGNVVILNHPKSFSILAIIPHYHNHQNNDENVYFQGEKLSTLSRNAFIGSKIDILKYSTANIANIKYLVIKDFIESNVVSNLEKFQEFSIESISKREKETDDFDNDSNGNYGFSYKGIITEITRINQELINLTIDNSLACIIPKGNNNDNNSKEMINYKPFDSIILHNLNVNKSLREKFEILHYNLAFQCPILANGTDKILMIFKDDILVMNHSSTNAIIFHLYIHIKTGKCPFNQLFPNRISIEQFKKNIEEIVGLNDLDNDRNNSLNSHSSLSMPSFLQKEKEKEKNKRKLENVSILGELRYSKTTGNLIFTDKTDFIEVVLSDHPPHSPPFPIQENLIDNFQECTCLISNPEFITFQWARQSIDVENIDSSCFMIEKNYLFLDYSSDNFHYISDMKMGKDDPFYRHQSQDNINENEWKKEYLVMIIKVHNPSVEEFQFEKGTVKMSTRLEFSILAQLVTENEIKKIISDNTNREKVSISISLGDYIKFQRPKEGQFCIWNGKNQFSNIDILFNPELIKGRYERRGEREGGLREKILLISSQVYEYLNGFREKFMANEGITKLQPLSKIIDSNVLIGRNGIEIKSELQSFCAIIKGKRILKSMELTREKENYSHSNKLSKHYFDLFSIGLPEMSDILIFDLEYSLETNLSIRVHYSINGRWLFPFEINIGDVCFFRDFLIKRGDQFYSSLSTPSTTHSSFSNIFSQKDIIFATTNSSTIRKLSLIENDLSGSRKMSIQFPFFLSKSSLSIESLSPKSKPLITFCYIKDFLHCFKSFQLYQVKARLLKIIHFELKATCKICRLAIKRGTCMIHGNIEKNGKKKEDQIVIETNVILEIWDRTLAARLAISDYNHIASIFLLEKWKQDNWIEFLISAGSFEFHSQFGKGETFSSLNHLSCHDQIINSESKIVSFSDMIKHREIEMNLDILKIAHLYKLWNMHVQVVDCKKEEKKNNFDQQKKFDILNPLSFSLKLMHVVPVDCLEECHKYMSILGI